MPWLPLALLLGAARYQMVLRPAPGAGQLAWYNDLGSRLIGEGLITSDPEWRDTYTLFEVQAERLRTVDDLQFKPARGSLLVRLPPGGEWRYGDRVRLEGYLYTPSENEDFSYKSYLAHQQIYTLFTCGGCLTCSDRPLETCARLVERDQGSAFKGAIYALRQRLVQTVHQLFPDPEAGLLAGILLGVETGISPQVLEAFRVTGTSHIIAISGFNFAVVAGLFVLVFGRLLGRWRGMLAAWLGIALIRGAGRGERQRGSFCHYGRGLDLCHPAGTPPERPEQPGVRGGGHGALRSNDPVGRRFPALLHGNAGVGAVRRAAGGPVYCVCQPLAAAGLSPQAGAAGGRIPAVYTGSPGDHPSADAVLLPAAFAGLAAGKPAGVAGPTAADGAGWAGGAAGTGLPAAGPAGGFPGLALDRLYHPDIGAPGPGAGGGIERGTGQPVAGGGVLCAAVRRHLLGRALVGLAESPVSGSRLPGWVGR